MPRPCDICVDEKCGGRHICHCETCSVRESCPKHLNATVRITNRCTQKCEHCCFASHPESKVMMSVEQAEKIARFNRNNGVERLNLMGGEFFCNPDWFEIFSILIPSVEMARIVTNGDWANDIRTKVKLNTLASLFKDKIWICVSKDKWHTNRNVELADAYLEEIGVHHNVATEEETTNGSIVPVGRAWGAYIGGIYDMFGCYCQNPKNQYSFMIDEEGNIYKCSFGVFCYANVDKYVDGGFRKRFKEVNTMFYKTFVPSCNTCYSSFMIHHKESVARRD